MSEYSRSKGLLQLTFIFVIVIGIAVLSFVSGLLPFNPKTIIFSLIFLIFMTLCALLGFFFRNKISQNINAFNWISALLGILLVILSIIKILTGKLDILTIFYLILGIFMVAYYLFERLKTSW